LSTMGVLAIGAVSAELSFGFCMEGPLRIFSNYSGQKNWRKSGEKLLSVARLHRQFCGPST